VEWPHFCELLRGDRISALVMSFGMPAIGGINQAAATTLFATFFLFALCKAFWHIRQREITLHREWMIRAFFGRACVATIRPIIGMFFCCEPLFRLDADEFFGIAFWIGLCCISSRGGLDSYDGRADHGWLSRIV